MEQMITKITPHCEHSKYLHRWQRVLNVIDGEPAVKCHDLKCLLSPEESYLRPIMPTNHSDANKQRNKAYINGARLYNATARTHTGYMGMLFRSDPVVADDFPSELEYQLENIDGSGMSIEQQAMAIANRVTSIGRDGLLTDMPERPNREVTRADVEAGLRPYAKRYAAENIIYWREAIIGGVKKLALLVLTETVDKLDENDPLGIYCEQEIQYRVYKLTESGVTYRLVTNDDDGQDEPLYAAGNAPLMEIPFTFVGSVNNTPDVDPVTLEDLACLNLGHYQESANIVSSSFNLSAAQPWIADDNYQRQMNSPSSGDKQELGEEVMIVLGSGGTFDITAPPENSLATGLMKDYEAQMVAVGAQVITDSSGNETAEAARIKKSSDVVTLSTIAKNISEAYKKHFYYSGLFLGVDVDTSYTLNQVFFDSKLTAQDLQAVVQTWQAGAISKTVLDNKLLEGGAIPQGTDLEEMNEQIEEEAASTGGVNFNEPQPTEPETDVNANE